MYKNCVRMSSGYYDHIVIGAGINGSSAAYQLAKRGTKVLLLEKVRTKTIFFSVLATTFTSSPSHTLEEAHMARAE